MLITLETIMSGAAIFANQVKDNIQMRKDGDRSCARQLRRLLRSVSRPQQPAGTRGSMHVGTACYNQAEKLQAADWESHSRPKHNLHAMTNDNDQAMTNDCYYSHAANDGRQLL